MSVGLGDVFVDTACSSFVSLDILKSLRCRLLDGDFLGDGERKQSEHQSEVTVSLFRNVRPHFLQLPWLSSVNEKATHEN